LVVETPAIVPLVKRSGNRPPSSNPTMISPSLLSVAIRDLRKLPMTHTYRVPHSNHSIQSVLGFCLTTVPFLETVNSAYYKSPPLLTKFSDLPLRVWSLSISACAFFFKRPPTPSNFQAEIAPLPGLLARIDKQCTSPKFCRPASLPLVFADDPFGISPISCS